mgnify:CR=1 FL=1
MPAANFGLLAAGQRSFRTVQFFNQTLVYMDRTQLRFAPPTSKPYSLSATLKNQYHDGYLYF